MFKKIKSSYFNILITFLLVIYFIYSLDVANINSQIKKINAQYFFLSLILFFPNTFLFILKWHLLIKKFSREKFANLYYKLSKSIIAAELIQNSIAIDAAKYIYLKKINIITKFILLFNDKFTTILSRLLYTIVFLIATAIFFSKNNNFFFFKIQNEFYLTLILSIILFISIVLFLNAKSSIIIKNFYLKK